MATPIKCMLAGEAPKVIQFPVMVSPKLDGIRCLVVDGVAMSRNWKPIPNRHVQKLLGTGAFDGLDGELIVGDPGAPDAYRKSMSGIMSEDGEPEFTYWVFDNLNVERQPFKTRFQSLHDLMDSGKLQYPACVVEHVVLNTQDELDEYEARQLASGLEGVILRATHGPYKHGRSTAKEGWLLKLKRFADAEAVVIGVQELLSNQNVAGTDALGHTERSTNREGMRPMGTLGALKVKDIKTGAVFNIGTGFTAALRQQLWNQRDAMVGMIAKYKYFETGSKDAPRFPVYIGWRSPLDMS